MWQQLVDVLGKLCTTYDGLSKLGERKRDALVGIDMDGLSKILDEEQLTAAKIQKLEKRRGEILKEISKNDMTVNENTEANDFYRKAPTLSMEKRLIELHKRLTKSVANAVKIRDNNRILAQSALDAAKFHLNRLSGAAVEPTYGRKGGDIVSHEKKFDYHA